jgi:hypothetical protein
MKVGAAIWVAEFHHNEREAISVFLGSTGLFFIGWLLTVGFKR